MAYQIFTSVPEPKINISLFGDAATQGAAVGKAIPTDTTAIIQGLQEGIDRGLSDIQKLEAIESTNLQQEKARAELPYAGAMAQERLEAQQLSNEKNQIQIEDALVNRQERQNLETATIEAKETELTARKQQLQREQQFLGQFKNASADEQINLVLGGQYADVFAQNKTMYEQALDTLYMNPNLAPAQRQTIDNLRKRSNAVGYYERLANTRAAQFQKAKEDLYASPLTAEILDNTTGMLPEDIPDKVEFVPAGKYQLSEDGTRFKVDPKTGRRMLAEGFDVNNPDLPNSYIAVLKDSNQIVGKSASKEDFQAYKAYVAARKLQDGTFGRIAADRLTKPQQQQQDAQKTQVASQPVPGESPEVSIIRKELQLTTAQYKDLKEPLRELTEFSIDYLDTKRSTTSQSLNKVKDLTQIKDTIVDYLIKDEWDNSKAVQSRYTESDVKEYNAQIEREMKAALGYVTLFTAGKGAPLVSKTDELSAPMKVNTPEELYAVQRKGVLERKINNVVRDLINYQKQLHSTRARATQGTKQTIQFLQAIRYGAPTAG